MNMAKAKYIIASGPVIIENNKVLLNRHGEDEKAKQYWKFVGGKIEDADFKKQNSILEEACMREVKEEMGVKVKILLPLKPMLIKHPDKKNTVVILIHYLAKRIGKIKMAKEIEEFAWFDIDKLPTNCAPNIKAVICEYKELKQKGLINV